MRHLEREKRLRMFAAILVGIVVILFAGVWLMRKSSRSSPGEVIRVGIPGPWNTIHPGLQHSLYGDLLLSNQFEALVGLNDSGVSTPLGAVSWSVSDDFRVFRFKIDTSKTFPDCSHLTAWDYKRSWEEAARLEPVSANSSLLDVLYKIEGFTNFRKTGEVAGIKAVDDDTLEITFKTPFRMALEHLQGNRFAAFKEVSGKFFGTGLFELERITDDRVILHPRNFAENIDTPTLEVQFVPAEEIVEALLAGRIDVIFYLAGDAPGIERLRDRSINVLSGLDALNLSINLNSSPKSLFSKREYRQALLFLVRQALERNRAYLPAEAFFQTDLQFYMPLQAGRLEQVRVDSIVAEGSRFAGDLIEATKLNPVAAKLQQRGARVFDLLKSTGITFTQDSGPISAKEFFSTVYSNEGPDILVAAFSVASGDPDGIYHVLGKHGAIRSPWIYSERVGDLLEEGRKITDMLALDRHYQYVSEALLEEVPMIHLGFAKAVLAYRNDRVEVDKAVLRRNQGQMHFLRYKP